MDLVGDIWAILQVILLDISLGGDNAIVIGMAAKGLPEHHQKKVIMFGAAGAVMARFLLAAIIVWLLTVPYLKTIGGLILTYIGMKLIGEEDTGGDEVHVEAKTTFWGAVETIVLADFIMSLDNVLAIVAATNENLELLVAGMLISVPVILLGSTIVVKIMDKFPWIIYVGSIVIGWAAGGMIVTDKHLGLPPEWGLYIKIGVTVLVAVGGFIWQKIANKNANKKNAAA